MSLSQLLEAAKYLDYLDSSNAQQLHQSQLQQSPPQNQQKNKKPSRRQRASKKNAADAMIAMSLPTSSGTTQMNSAPIPVGSNQHGASLSSSLTTGSPSSFASTALMCSKASGVTSASSSAASSLSSSESSSSSGEIMMGNNDFSHNGRKHSKNQSNTLHNYHLTHQQMCNQQVSTPQFGSCSSSSGYSSNNHTFARYIAATSAGPQLVTMTTDSSMVSTSAPIESSLRAGHVIHAANNGAHLDSSRGGFDPRNYSRTNMETIHNHEVRALNMTASSFGSDTQLSGSSGSCHPMIMTRVQPMILNSLSPSAQSIVAFQSANASSPTSSSSSYSRHRELHKTLEKNRRAHLRHCFELLKSELPVSDCADRKTSHINIIKSAIRYVLALRQQEMEIDNELQKLTKIKNELTDSLSKIRNNQSQNEQQPISESQTKQEQQPAPEQHLSFLLSQSKIEG